MTGRGLAWVVAGKWLRHNDLRSSLHTGQGLEPVGGIAGYRKGVSDLTACSAESGGVFRTPGLRRPIRCQSLQLT